MNNSSSDEEQDNPQRSKKWSWFIEECSEDLQRRRNIYSFGQTVQCKGMYGTIFVEEDNKQHETLANICLFLPRPLPLALGPLDHYVTKVRAMLLKQKAIPPGSWLGFDAGPFQLPFHPWSYSSGLGNILQYQANADFQRRIQDLYEQMERPNRHYNRRLQNYFCGSGVEPALTLAITSYISHFCLHKIDVFHLYTAVLFSGEILKKFEQKVAKINKAIRNQIEEHLRSEIDKKESLSLPHPFETQALDLILSQEIEEIFLYVYQYANFNDLQYFIGEDLAPGPHFFFKFIWKGVPFNKLFLAFLKLKPTDQFTFASDMLLNKFPDAPAPTGFFSEFHMFGEVPFYERPGFFKEHWPIRRGYRLDGSLIGGKVPKFIFPFTMPGRGLGWEEEMLLTCCTPNELKSELVKDLEIFIEFEQINSIEVEKEIQHVPNERIHIWENFDFPNEGKSTEAAESTEETIGTPKKAAVSEGGSSTDLFPCTSYPLDSSTRQLYLFLTDSIEVPDILEDIKIRCNIEDLIAAVGRIDDSDMSDEETSEIYTGELFGGGDELIEDSARSALLDWLEDKMIEIEGIKSDIFSWNPLWELKPFCEQLSEEIPSSSESDLISEDLGFEEERRSEDYPRFVDLRFSEDPGYEDHESEEDLRSVEDPRSKEDRRSEVDRRSSTDLRSEDLKSEELRSEEDLGSEEYQGSKEDLRSGENIKSGQDLEFSEIAADIKPTSVENSSLAQRKWIDRHKESPYWLQTIWKKIMWINWRGRDTSWIVDTLNKIDYLLLRRQILEDISFEYKEYIEDDDWSENSVENPDLETNKSSNSSLISEHSSSSSGMTGKNMSSISEEETSEPVRESLECFSSLSSISATDCIYNRSIFCAPSRWERPSTPPLSRYLLRSVVFFEMCSRVYRQKEELLHHALEKEALSNAPPKLYLCRQIQRFINLFLENETNILNRLTGLASSSLTSIASHATPYRSRGRPTGEGFRLSKGRSFVLTNCQDLGDWLQHFGMQIRQPEVQTRNRLQGCLRALDNFKRLVLERFLGEVSSIEEITESVRWKLSVKRPIRSQDAFLNFCCRIGPIRNATFFCDLLLQSESLRALIILRIEELKMMLHRGRKKRKQPSVGTATSSVLMSANDSGSESSTHDNEVSFHEEDITTKWPRKTEWPSKEEDEEGLEIHWLDASIFEQWLSCYPTQDMGRRIIVLLSLRHLRQMNYLHASTRTHKN